MTIVLKKENGWWWADIDSKHMFAVALSTEKAGDVWEKVKQGNPEAKIGIESKAIGPACQLTYGPIVWMK